MRREGIGCGIGCDGLVGGKGSASVVFEFNLLVVEKKNGIV